MANLKSKSASELLIRILKKESKVSFGVLSKKTGKDFDELADIFVALEKKGVLRIIYPVIGSPYVTLK